MELLEVSRLDLEEELVQRLQVDRAEPADMQSHSYVRKILHRLGRADQPGILEQAERAIHLVVERLRPIFQQRIAGIARELIRSGQIVLGEDGEESEETEGAQDPQSTG